MPNIEDILRKAMQEGKFNNLPGKGKKLHLNETNPHADPDWVLAYGILKDAGYSLPWIETRRDIERDIEAAREDLRQAWETFNYGVAQSHTDMFVKPEWERAQRAFRTRMDSLNNRIREYNLSVPAPRFQRTVLSFEQEVQKVTS